MCVCMSVNKRREREDGVPDRRDHEGHLRHGVQPRMATHRLESLM